MVFCVAVNPLKSTPGNSYCWLVLCATSQVVAKNAMASILTILFPAVGKVIQLFSQRTRQRLRRSTQNGRPSQNVIPGPAFGDVVVHHRRWMFGLDF